MCAYTSRDSTAPPDVDARAEEYCNEGVASLVAGYQDVASEKGADILPIVLNIAPG